MKDIIGQALLDYQNDNYTEDISTSSYLTKEDSIPIPYLFRSFDEMPVIEQKALALAKGSTLDIGCGAGIHSLYLQNTKKLEVTAIDTSAGAIAVCKKKGLANAKLLDLYDLKDQKFDTILALMNGIGIAKQLKAVPRFLEHLKSLLKPDGQILLDSSDIIYMFEKDSDGGFYIPGHIDYYGELVFTTSYKGNSTEVPWVFVDYNTLVKHVTESGFNCELIQKGTHYDFLLRLTHSD